MKPNASQRKAQPSACATSHPPIDPKEDLLPELPRFEGKLRKHQHAVGLVVDCETTGPSGERNAIVETALLAFVVDLRLENFMGVLGVYDVYSGLQDPGDAELNPVAMRIHGLKLDQLRGQRLDRARIQRLIRKAEFVIAHNVGYDRRFLVPAFPALGSLPWHCTYQGLPWRELGFQCMKLRVLCDHYGLRPPSHRSLEDVRATYELLAQPFDQGHTVLQALLMKAHPLASSF